MWYFKISISYWNIHFYIGFLIRKPDSRVTEKISEEYIRYWWTVFSVFRITWCSYSNWFGTGSKSKEEKCCDRYTSKFVFQLLYHKVNIYFKIFNSLTRQSCQYEMMKVKMLHVSTLVYRGSISSQIVDCKIQLVISLS